MAAVCTLIAACDEEKKPHEVTGASPSAIASMLAIDASLGVLVDPEKPAGDLAQDLATFTTVEACMKQRANLDPVVGDAIDAIGYDTFLRDACRVLEAAKNKDMKRCELIDASSLRNRCRAVTAMVIGDAEACPLKAASKPELGRDATCVAAALRSPAMCLGAQKHDRAACDALVSHDAKKCEPTAFDEQRILCARDAARFRSALVGNAVIASVAAPKGTLTLHGDGRADPAQTTADLDADIGSGAVVVLDGKHTRVQLGHVAQVEATPHAAQPLERTRFAIAIATSATDKPMEILEASLTVPGAPEAACVADHCTLTVKIVKLETKRAGAVELAVDGTLGGFRVHADITTFVRDVVDRGILHP